MILTVSLNAALDLTYHVPVLVSGSTHRVTEVAEPGPTVRLDDWRRLRHAVTVEES